MLTNRDAKYQLNDHSRNQTTTPPRKRLPSALCCSKIRSALIPVERSVLKPFVSILTTSSPFDSLFRVLFIFRSRYLFAIGLRVIFRFRRNSSPNLRHKSQSARLDDITTYSGSLLDHVTGLSPSQAPCSNGLWPSVHQMQHRKPTTRSHQWRPRFSG